ncbi:type 1 glutamine amidotransferase domain-containing protein [Thalassotalea sp. PS06]|uniref:type 1 glutamine amidotransferase domain-containing protein n=1 Tax=Thalassotalea sp. PS06 TaxID=2594005 RepID=UPI001164C4B4|nr:type 1 glutamine amidotransferase domain-containing protein [Thalassotalea sp. PS06]QDP00992.1 type 1 glutamine amidotransferase domain-containing protein [Thalassotalea sp. PS06]
MRSLSLVIFLLVSCIATAASADKTTKQKKIALVISGYASQGNPALSYDQEELAQSYLTLINNGIDIDIISPQGGAVLVKTNKDDLPYIQQFKNNTQALTQLANTLSAEQAKTQHYDGLFIVGGDGAMFDLPKHRGIQSLIQKFAQQDKPIAAVCHGPAALVDIKLQDGSYFVAGKTVNSFTLTEDQAFKKEHIELYPFIVQTELEKRGANFVANKPMLPYVAQDGNLITAQNPMSVAKAAEALVLKLGVTPKVRKMFKDEATFDLLSRAENEGFNLIDVEIAKNPSAYDYNYMALYGYYAFQIAKTPEQKRFQLKLMAQLRDHVVEYQPRYQLALISANLELDLQEQAKQEYAWWLVNFPEQNIPDALLTKLKL